VHVKETVFAKFAEGIDCFGIRVGEARQIRTALTRAFRVADRGCCRCDERLSV
jgi:hypothetical protein